MENVHTPNTVMHNYWLLMMAQGAKLEWKTISGIKWKEVKPYFFNLNMFNNVTIQFRFKDDVKLVEPYYGVLVMNQPYWIPMFYNSVVSKSFMVFWTGDTYDKHIQSLGMLHLSQRSADNQHDLLTNVKGN